MSDEFLEHFGVKGMQWGVRRTKAQLRAANDNRKAKKDPSTPEGKVISDRKAAASNRRVLSEDEVNSLVSRLEKEKKLKKLVEEDTAPGKAFARDIMENKGKALVGTVAAGAATVVVKHVVMNHMKLGNKDAETIVRGKVKR